MWLHLISFINYILLLYIYSKMSPLFCLTAVCERKKSIFKIYQSLLKLFFIAQISLKVSLSETIRHSETLFPCGELIKTHRIWGERESLKALNVGFKSLKKM